MRFGKSIAVQVLEAEEGLERNIPRAMERNIRGRAIPIELYAQRGRMAREAQLRRRTRCARRVAAGADGELRAHFDVLVVGDHGGVPGGEAFGIAEVGAALGRGAVEGAVVVELFCGGWGQFGVFVGAGFGGGARGEGKGGG